MPDGIVTFPGINQILTASYSWSRGIRPGTAQIEIVPQLNFVALAGNMVWTDQNATITLTSCRVDMFSFARDQRGLIWQLRIFDRRWKWEFPTIAGHYNLRHDDGALINDSTGAANIIWDTKKNVQELATLCLRQMGEVTFDVSVLPTNAYPLVEWEIDKAAVALENLCDEYGCHVVLSLDDRVVICQTGTGAPLPVNGFILSNSGALDIAETPDYVSVATAPIRIQADLLLEAVGRELNGDIKLINELSYTPIDGWPNTDISQWTAVSAGAEQARRTVYHMYRVQLPFSCYVLNDDGTPSLVVITDAEQIAPLEDSQCDTVLIDGLTQNRSPLVWGVWCAGDEAYTNGQTQLLTINNATIDAMELIPPASPTLLTADQQYVRDAVYNRGFSIDRDNLIVTFSDPVYMTNTVYGANINVAGVPQATPSLTFSPADLILRVAFTYRDQNTRAYRRLFVSKATGQSNGTASRIDIKEDLIPVIINKYGFPGGIPSGQINNLNGIIPSGGIGGPGGAGTDNIFSAAKYYLDGILQGYQATTPQTANYAWLQPVSLDGAIFQITYDFSTGGFFTTISRNTESQEHTIPYKLARFYAKVKAGLIKVNPPTGQTSRRTLARTPGSGFF